MHLACRGEPGQGDACRVTGAALEISAGAGTVTSEPESTSLGEKRISRERFSEIYADVCCIYIENIVHVYDKLSSNGNLELTSSKRKCIKFRHLNPYTRSIE